MEKYRQFLVSEKGKSKASISEFKLFTDYIEVQEILLTHRASKVKYQLDIDQTFKKTLERDIQQYPNLVNLSIDNVFINNSGTAICLQFFSLYRSNKRIKSVSFFASCFNLDHSKALFE